MKGNFGRVEWKFYYYSIRTKYSRNIISLLPVDRLFEYLTSALYNASFCFAWKESSYDIMHSPVT